LQKRTRQATAEFLPAFSVNHSIAAYDWPLDAFAGENEMSGLQIEISRESIEAIVRPIVEGTLAEMQPALHDEEADKTARILQRINAKMFITIPEFAFLFNCSRGHVDKLLEQAQMEDTKYPVPYLDLNGLVQFDRVAVLEWAKTAKPLLKKQRKTGGKKNGHSLALTSGKRC
jgi:hypothetical protein